MQVFAALLLMNQQLTRLAPVDVFILVLYFALVVFIGFYAKSKANTSEDFFLAGREMTAWIAGLSFVSANLGSLELMGWAGAAYQYGILATHWYWIGAIPAMLFLGIVMMPFYYISKTHSVPGYLQLRFGEGARALSAISFAVMTILMSGVNMFAMAVVMQTVLGWNITFSIWVGAATVALYVMLGGLRSAIINEVLAVRADLGRCGDDSNSRPDRSRKLDEPEGTDCGQRRQKRLHASVEHARSLQRQSDGCALDGNRLWLGLRDQLRILDDGLSRGSASVERTQSAGCQRWLR